jgi:altronate dehydratase large subunit
MWLANEAEEIWPGKQGSEMSRVENKRLGFWGYRRSDGRVGVRNLVAVISVMDLSNTVVRKISSLVRGSVSILPQFGRLLLGPDAAQHKRTLIGVGNNPNIFAALVVSLEPDSAREIADGIKESGKRVHILDVQSSGGSLQATIAGARMAGELVLEASQARRAWCPLRDLALGLKCGGSDTTSGIAANPAIGVVADRVIESGGTVLFSEPCELMGAEEMLGERALIREVANAIVAAVAYREQLAFKHGLDVRGTNPTPDNIAGGITTVEEKAFGSLVKTGTTTIQGVVPYAFRPPGTGLWFMDGPGPAVELMAGMVAAGAQMMLFSTGVGNPVGSPVAPTLRVTGHPSTARDAWENIDFDASGVTLGVQSVGEAGERLLHHLLRVLSGELTKCEIFDDQEFAISRIEETL